MATNPAFSFNTSNLSDFQKEFFEGDPQALYYAALPTDASFGQKQFFQSQYQPIFSEFLGQNVRRGMSGLDAMPFLDYMSDLDLMERHRQAPSYVTGTRTAPLASKGRFLYGM